MIKRLKDFGCALIIAVLWLVAGVLALVWPNMAKRFAVGIIKGLKKGLEEHEVET